MANNIGYHTRLSSDNTVKMVGGSFGGSIDMETVNRLVSAHFSVNVRPGGRPVFVDKSGREVSLYFTIDPGATVIGKLALEEYREEQERQARIDEEREEREESERNDAMAGLTHDEIIRRLKGVES